MTARNLSNPKMNAGGLVNVSEKNASWLAFHAIVAGDLVALQNIVDNHPILIEDDAWWSAAVLRDDKVIAEYLISRVFPLTPARLLVTAWYGVETFVTCFDHIEWTRFDLLTVAWEALLRDFPHQMYSTFYARQTTSKAIARLVVELLTLRQQVDLLARFLDKCPEASSDYPQVFAKWLCPANTPNVDVLKQWYYMDGWANDGWANGKITTGEFLNVVAKVPLLNHPVFLWQSLSKFPQTSWGSILGSNTIADVWIPWAQLVLEYKPTRTTITAWPTPTLFVAPTYTETETPTTSLQWYDSIVRKQYPASSPRFSISTAHQRELILAAATANAPELLPALTTSLELPIVLKVIQYSPTVAWDIFRAGKAQGSPDSYFHVLALRCRGELLAFLYPDVRSYGNMLVIPWTSICDLSISTEEFALFVKYCPSTAWKLAREAYQPAWLLMYKELHPWPAQKLPIPRLVEDKHKFLLWHQWLRAHVPEICP